MSYIRVGAPRNTSNGDYGRFHFSSNLAADQHQQNTHYSTDGNRMMQHVHYPNCPNRNSPNKFTDGMKEYTVEYGEDAVRAALGGNMPDFQAQFQKQYGGNYNASAAGYNLDPQSIQMMNNGKSNVAMIPVVLTSEEDGDGSGSNMKMNAASASANNSNQQDDACHAPSKTSVGDVPPAAGYPAPQCETEGRQESSGAVMAPKQENIANAFESVRKARSTSQVKYGRHVRPSYWKPETPNPCRKKIAAGGGGDLNYIANGIQEEMSASAMPQDPSYTANANNDMSMSANGYFAPPPMIPVNSQQQQSSTAYQRARSLPQKQSVKPMYSLCGKCKKCKNLRSETSEASVLTFPKYATEGFQRHSQKSPQMLTSSNLGQSAKNFRAIRFSSNML